MSDMCPCTQLAGVVGAYTSVHTSYTISVFLASAMTNEEKVKPPVAHDVSQNLPSSLFGPLELFLREIDVMPVPRSRL